MMKKNKTFAVIIMMIIFALCGCSDKADVVNIQAGQRLERIISTSPSNTEILVGLGLGHNLVAIDNYSTDIEGVSESVVVLNIEALSAEEMLALKPDIIVASEINVIAAGDDPFSILKDAGIQVVYTKTASSINEIYEQITYIMTLTGKEERGHEMINSMKSKIDQIERKVEKLGAKKTVYFEIEPAPSIYTFGSGTYINEMLEIAGGVNIFADKSLWISPGEESILDANPEVIITNVNYVDNPLEEIKSRSNWGSLKAVQNNNVFYVDANFTSRPSQNIVKGIELIFSVLYPES